MASNLPPPPPRIEGDPQNPVPDITAVAQYLHAFYVSTVVDGYFASQEFLDESLTSLAAGEPVDLENLPDPLNTTISAAQAVANAAYTLATKLETDQSSGSVTISETDTSAVVTLSPAEPDTDYRVVASPSAETGAPAANARVVTTITKATGSFTLNILTAPGVGTSVTFDWIKHRN